jgi:hypothetical protein
LWLRISEENGWNTASKAAAAQTAAASSTPSRTASARDRGRCTIRTRESSTSGITAYPSM